MTMLTRLPVYLGIRTVEVGPARLAAELVAMAQGTVLIPEKSA